MRYFDVVCVNIVAIMLNLFEMNELYTIFSYIAIDF